MRALKAPRVNPDDVVTKHNARKKKDGKEFPSSLFLRRGEDQRQAEKIMRN